MRWTFIIIPIVLFVLFADFGLASAAVMSSGSYKIQIDSVNVGGTRASSTSYVLEQTTGESATGRATSTSQTLYAGFQIPEAAATPSPSAAATPGASSAGTRRAQGSLLNVENFTATPGNEQVQLEWANPQDVDFVGVRVVRNEAFYPSNPEDGTIIYEGSGESFLDTGLEQGQHYYYGAFLYDPYGHFSSGAVAFATPFAPGVSPPTAPTPPEIPPVPPELIPEPLKYLSLLDFDFFQKGSKLPVVNGKVQAEADAPFTIAIDYDKLPEVLKTILVTMENSEGEVFFFLLRVDEEKQWYRATLKPPASGAYGLTFVVVDYQNQGLQKVSGELQVKEAVAGFAAPPPSDGFGRSLPELLLFLLTALFLLAFAKYIHKKLSEKPEKEFQMSKLK